MPPPSRPCGDTGDFTVDFDDRGMDSNQYDGTDWGRDDAEPIYPPMEGVKDGEPAAQLAIRLARAPAGREPGPGRQAASDASC